MIDQQEETERERPGMTWALRSLYRPSAKSALTHHQQAGGGMACGHRAPSGVAPPGGLPCWYTSRRQRLLVHRMQLRRSPGAWGPSATNKRHRVYTCALLATMVTPPKKGGRSPYAAAHTQATMGGNRTDEALLELSTLVLANCQPALPLRRSICAG